MGDKLNFDGGLTCAMQAADMDRAIAFYRDVLGFQLLYRMDEMAWCELSTPVARVNVGLSQVERPQFEGGATLTFGVTDIDAARSNLAHQGVRFDGDIQTIEGMVKLTTFFDSEGNKLMLYQDLSEQK